MVGIAALEKAVHAKFVVDHLEIEDTSSGCGENYFVLLVSEVKQSSIRVFLFLKASRILKARIPLRGTE